MVSTLADTMGLIAFWPPVGVAWTAERCGHPHGVQTAGCDRLAAAQMRPRPPAAQGRCTDQLYGATIEAT